MDSVDPQAPIIWRCATLMPRQATAPLFGARAGCPRRVAVGLGAEGVVPYRPGECSASRRYRHAPSKVPR